MKKVGRKVVSVLLTLCMLLTMLPVSALAADEGTVDTAPAENALAESAPAETTPAETTPAETTPAETTPAETTPAETTPAESTEDVAQIGDQTYPTLENAFDAVGSDAVTIKLLADTQISNAIEVPEGKTITLDLNSCAVTVPEAVSGRSIYAISNYGTLTIRDTSAEKDGSISSRGVQNLENGILTLESGTINSIDSNGGGAAVWNEATFYMTGGTLAFTGEKSGNNSGTPLSNQFGATATITGGSLLSPYTCVFNSGHMKISNVSLAGQTAYWHVIKTYGGSDLELRDVIVDATLGGGIEAAGGTVNIYGCTFTQKGYSDWNSVNVAVSGGGTVNVHSGTFTSENYGAYVFNSGGTINVEGGTFSAGRTVLKADNSTTSNPSVINVADGAFTGKLEIGSSSTLSISGGTFSVEIPEKYCAEGFVPQENADGTWGVVKKNEAEINGKQYATLSEALNKVQDGETIKVLAPATVDMAETYAITGKAITLDLNGQTVTWNTSAKAAITVKDGGKLTIQDTSANEAGELAFTSTYNDSGDSTGIYVNPNGTFALQSGTISYTAAKGRAIYVGVTGTFAMSGGTVKIAGRAKYGVYLSSNNSTNITGGEIILSDTLTGTALYGLYVYMLADAQGLAIENLTVDASAVPAAQCAYCITGGWISANNAPVTISGGTYTTNENTLSKAIYYSTVKNLTISGGTFNGVVDSATTITDGTFQKAVKVTDTITGGTFEGKVTAPSGKISGGKFKVVNPPYDWNLADGKSFEQKDGYYCVVDDTNTKVAEVGDVQYATLEEAIKKAQSGQTVELLANATVLERIAIADKNITIDTNGYSVIYSGDADHKSAIIDLEGKAQVVVTGNGTFTFNDAYLDYNGFGYIFRLYDNSVLTIENGTYYAGLTCVQVGDSSAAYIKDGHFSASTDWKDTWWVLNRIDNNNSKFYVSGGTFVNYDPTNSDTESPTDNFCTPEYAATPTKDESGNTIYTVVEAEARIGETGYVTLADAIAAAEDNATITLLADVTEDVVVPAGKNITLDLYGHKITNDSDHTIVNNGTLTITDSSEAKTGTVDNVTHGKGALVNNGTVKLSGGTFERSLEAGTLAGANGNSWYTIVNDGTMIIENGVTVKNKGGFSSMICNSKSGVMGNLTIDGGTFDGGINTVKNDVNSTLTINGGTFTNSAQYVIMNWNKATINDGTFATKDTAYAVLFTSSWQNASTSVGELVITGGTFTTATEEQKLIVDRYDADNIGTASISGGTFSEKPDDTYLVDGYAPEQNDKGDWVVVEEDFVAEIVDDQKYESLIEAVEAATAGQTVKLLADVELKPIENQDYVLMIDVNQSMTLDLNGHKITAEFTNTEGFDLIKNYGELTITDTSEGKGGSIEVTENGSAEKSRTSVIYNGYSSGKFTLEAGTLKLTGSEGSKKPLSGVYSSGTTMVMNGGAIEVRRLNSYSEYSKAWDVYGIYNSNNCQTTVNGGKITVENQGRYNSAYGINNASGTVSIHGDPNTPYIEANAFDDGTWYEHTLTGKITLYGGKYNMLTNTATGWIENENNITIAEGYEKKFNGDRTVSIVKSPVAQIGSTKYDTLEEALKEAKSGDTIKLLQNVALTDRVIISKNITLNLNDKTISSTADYAFIVNTGNSFTLENGTLSASQNGVFGLTSSTVTLANDATINAGAAGITATNNLLEQGNATINVYGTIHSQDIAVWSQGPKNTINIDSATITSKYFGVYQNGSFGGTTITIKNSTITDESENGTGIYVSNNGTNAENPDQGFQNLIIENSTITGNTALEVKFTNVTISGDDTCLTATGTPVDSGMNNNGSVTTGYAFAVTHNGTESSKDAAEGTVTISGGKFTGAVGIQEPSEGETTSATISISGGSFSEEPNKDYLAPYYEASQNTTGDNYWTVDVAEEYEATWTNGETLEAGTLDAMLDAANAAKAGTVALLKDIAASGIHVSAGVTLDLAGHELDATGSEFTAYGKVVDSTEGEGLLKLPAEYYTIQKDNPSLPIYDSTAGGYRLYTYQLTTLRTYEPGTANTVQFWFKLTFTNEEAWELLTTDNENHGITVKSKYQFSGQTASESWFSFNSEFIHWIADQVVSSQYTQDQLGFYLNVTNTNLLGERTMTVTPAVDSVPSVGTESEQMTYSLNLGE
ncbi:hypothetical protein [Flavonifractor sp. An91]|uniref:hypothetical protein n=1 Tax=Flavonifractor sp. An91 TaxID=1965665 RepID=UPI000B370DBA|nr:hypothetical protein [Flavonifractor sp. An91]OUN10382.1 hypothetical protein B5G42_10550 [Flavonifractor sp. An91]